MDDVKTMDLIVKKKEVIGKHTLNILKIVGKVLIIILFVAMSAFVATNHEHWSDEAQSFLLARDNSLFELFGYMKYEGTPPLWVLVLKLFIFLGGTYETLLILPILFSTIGLTIFEFKIKAPWYIKILLPFTYFIFYQYSVVARSYCMVFPLLMIIASIYEKRLEKPILYSVVLLFFMNISLHTLIISGSLYFIFLLDLFKHKRFKEKKIIIACILIFLELLLACIFTLPANDCTYIPKNGENLPHVISEATIGSNFEGIWELIICIIILEMFLAILKKEQLINSLILIIPVTAVLMFITFQGWHIGIVWLIIFTTFILNGLLENNKIIKIFTFIVCLVQIYWTMSSINYDISNNYSASKDVAIFLKENNFEEKTIYGLGYSVTAIQPYFDYNIFENQKTDKSFYSWKKDTGYMSESDIINNKGDIYIVSKFYAYQYIHLMRYLENEGYTKYQFNGDTYIKNKKYESEGYYVYIK